MNANLDERWDELLEAVRTEFRRRGQDPGAVFEPNRDQLKLRACLDRSVPNPDWISVTLTPDQVLTGDHAGIAAEFVALYRKEKERDQGSGL